MHIQIIIAVVEHGKDPSSPALFAERPFNHVVLCILPENTSSIPVHNIILKVASIFTSFVRATVGTDNHDMPKGRPSILAGHTRVL